MGLFKQLMIFGKTGLQGLPTRVTLFLWGFSRQGATGVPLFTTWDCVAGPGKTPMPAGDDLDNRAVAVWVGRLGGDGFWMGDYGGGGPSRSPFWRTPKESCKGLGSMSLKINTQHTPLHRQDSAEIKRALDFSL